MLFGRDVERARIGALLDGARASRSGVLVVRGEPGIGKTALLEDARDRAADMDVLAARGVESEAELPFAGLHQLLRPALPLAEHLPGPQAIALRSALGLAGPGGDDRFLISLAVLTLLAELAERRPVLCLIDDAQWLDAPSRDALLFVARRLDAEGIVLVFAVREDDARSFEARELPSVFLGRLDDEAAAALLRRDIPGSAAPAVRESLLAQAGGNALALVELPGALTAAQLVGEEPLPERAAGQPRTPAHLPRARTSTTRANATAARHRRGRRQRRAAAGHVRGRSTRHRRRGTGARGGCPAPVGARHQCAIPASACA